MSVVHQSWLNLIGSPQAVLGPCHGIAPSLEQFRISALLINGLGAHLFGSITNFPDNSNDTQTNGRTVKLSVYLSCGAISLERLHGAPSLDPELDDSMHGFEVALPVHVRIEQTAQRWVPDEERYLLRISGESSHFSFQMTAPHVDMSVGRRAAKGFEIALPGEVRAL